MHIRGTKNVICNLSLEIILSGQKSYYLLQNPLKYIIKIYAVASKLFKLPFCNLLFVNKLLTLY